MTISLCNAQFIAVSSFRARLRPRRLALCLSSLFVLSVAFGARGLAQASSSSTMHLTLDEAIDLALKQNHSVRLRTLSIDQMQSKKDEARSYYYPQIKATGSVLYLTELEGVAIPAGTFGNPPATGPIPSKPLLIDQGSDTAYTGGVGLEQPLTQLFRIHEANAAAQQDVSIAKTQLDQTQDVIALQVRQLYYNILINEQKLDASQDQLAAARIKDEESRSDVERGNALEDAALQSQASILQAQQESLTLRLEGQDLLRQLAGALGLPVNTRIELDPTTADVPLNIPSRGDAVQIALEQNQDMRIARQRLVKAQADLATAKDAYIPDLTALSHYHYASGVPFLAHNFGTFGFSLNYDLFDGGRREAAIRGARSEVRSAEVEVDKLRDDIEVQVQGIYDRIDELRQLVEVAGQVVRVRTESARLADRKFEQNAALSSVKSQAHADLATANASLLQAKFGFSLAQADLKRAIGQRPQ